MNQEEIEKIAAEINDSFHGRRGGRVFPLSTNAFAIDFDPHSGAYLFVEYSKKSVSAFLIVRKLKELERSVTQPTEFVGQIKEHFQGGRLEATKFCEGAIVLIFQFNGKPSTQMWLQIGGDRPNVLILDENSHLISAALQGLVEVQPKLTSKSLYDAGKAGDRPVETEHYQTLSKKLDLKRTELINAHRFEALAALARKKLAKETRKKERLIINLETDLKGHGDPAEWKALGELILANISELTREGDTITVTDYFDPELSKKSISAPSNLSPIEVAEKYFRKYTKARNAVREITLRKEVVGEELAKLEEKTKTIEDAIVNRFEASLISFLEVKVPNPKKASKSESIGFKGARRFISKDGFEILVGKKAPDNDYLTFRIAKSLDTWLHASDYPGSHVVIRNPSRKEIPSDTLVGAAQLAAFYSDARKSPKVTVKYTQRKFVHKPRKSAPGLVSLSNFKTLLVQPCVPSTVEHMLD